MSYKKMLVTFMEAKKAEIIKVLGSEYGELYFNEEDKQELLALSEVTAWDVWASICMYVSRYASGLTNITCPFCFVADRKCLNCEYGKRHRICGKPQMRSDYKNIIAKFKRMKCNYNEIFSSSFYYELVKRAERGGT